MRIKDIADLAESHADSETDNQNSKERIAQDNDIEMADGKNHEQVEDEVVEVHTESELEGPETVKVSDLELDNENFVNDRWCAVRQKRKTARSRGDTQAAVDKEKEKSRQKTRWLFFLLLFNNMIFSRRLSMDQCGQIR